MSKSKILECIKYNKLLGSKVSQIGTFGNLSIKIDTINMFIKPSGINYKRLNENQFYPVNFKNINSRHKYKPSVDSETHLYLYKHLPLINCIAHFHSKYATIWSQSCKNIPILGTTHADYFKNEILVTKKLNKNEINKNYQINIAKSILKIFKEKKYSYLDCPGVLVANHGAFVWGISAEDVINKSIILEFISELAFKSLQINKNINVSKHLIEKHFSRKNGNSSYYGQK